MINVCILAVRICILVSVLLQDEDPMCILVSGAADVEREDELILKLEQDLTKHEIEVLIRYASRNRDVERLISILRAADTTIGCSSDGCELLLGASEIFYIESVDKKTFVYCETAVCRTELRLYQLLEKLRPAGFVQISKSCLLNVNVLTSIRPLLNSRMEATLTNGERLYVSRRYLGDIKAVLQKERS